MKPDTFQTELFNSTDKPVDGILRVNYELGVVEQKVNLKAGESLTCRFTPDEFKKLAVTFDRLPARTGNRQGDGAISLVVREPLLFSQEAMLIKELVT